MLIHTPLINWKCKRYLNFQKK